MSYLEKNDYPRLRSLMACYINMDAFEITGFHDIDGILGYYCTRVSTKSKKELLVEVDNFENEYQIDLDDKFESFFDYGYDVGNTKALFSKIREIVENDIDKVE